MVAAKTAHLWVFVSTASISFATCNYFEVVEVSIIKLIDFGILFLI